MSLTFIETNLYVLLIESALYDLIFARALMMSVNSIAMGGFEV